MENYILSNFLSKVGSWKMNQNNNLLDIEKNISHWIDNKKVNMLSNKYSLGM